ncbi:MAG: hypothetical protein HKN44_13150 [Ilumatobacter sp.]|nr:hypothetical protein [Ilumatobacter sp.]
MQAPPRPQDCVLPAPPSPSGAPAFSPPTAADAEQRVPAIPPPALPGIGGPAALPVTIRPEDGPPPPPSLATDPARVPIAPPGMSDAIPPPPVSGRDHEPPAVSAPTVPVPIVSAEPADVPEAPADVDAPVAADAPAVPTLAPVLPAAAMVPTLPAVPPPPAKIVALEQFESMEPRPDSAPPSPPAVVGPVGDTEADPVADHAVDIGAESDAEPAVDVDVAPVEVPVSDIVDEPSDAPAAAPAASPTAPEPPTSAPETTSVGATSMAAQLAMPPSLPSITAAAPSPVATDDSSWQDDAVAWSPEDVPSARQAKKQSNASPARTALLTLSMAVFAFVAGAGAHLGYDWYNERDGAATASSMPDRPGDLAAWNQIDPPAIRFTDTTTTIVTDLGLREVTAHRDLVSGSRVVSVSETTFAGETSSFEVDLRDTRAFVRPDPDSPWSPTTVEEATSIIGDEGLTDVFTISDLFPAEALPFAVVLESAESKLPLGAIRQVPAGPADGAVRGDGEAAPADDAAARPASRPAVAEPPAGLEPTTVWHYSVTLDIEAFRAAEGAAFAAWESQLGRAAGTQFDVWVDADGIVRQLVIDASGAKVTQTLVSGAPTSTKFDVEPLIGTAPAPTDETPVDAAPEVDGS